ncbi:Calmodulin binding protein-like protein [Rhynchospora pubera]|uniref:Calmodulin binding protein-like protein n=1 Tax=Rhynchospora pubera TaxID=906938 RepID=A0AAV8GV17_9POAL|nr:Calmodulin binding protein-like protein [Rhynchospora pubera]
MAPKRKLGPSSEGAGPSRPAKSRGLTSSFQENTTDPFLLEMHHMIRTLNCKMEEFQAEIRAQNCKIEELRAKVVGINEQSPSILENPIDENLTTREPANQGQCELMIMNNIKKRVYTDSEVQGQDGEILKVAICYNGQKITSGPLASARFEVVVLESNSIKLQESLVKGRPEVGSVLANEYISQFSNGEAVLQGLKFKDNSNWAPGKKWCLGIRILEEFNVKIKEAISGPFRVLDRRGKASEKPDIPLLDHGVGCLEKVGKERVSVLKKNGIHTVKDFLQLYHVNPTKLLEVRKEMYFKCMHNSEFALFLLLCSNKCF